MMKSNLKYLYRAVYNDGSVYDQNLDDISVTDQAKSCYHDIRLDEVKYFTLSDGLHSYVLDLGDGGFCINGSPKFYLNDEKGLLKLVHYRRMTMNLDETGRNYTMHFVLGYSIIGPDGITRQYCITIK